VHRRAWRDLELDTKGKELRRWDADDKGRKFDEESTISWSRRAEARMPPCSDPIRAFRPRGRSIVYLRPAESSGSRSRNDLNYANGIGISPDQKTLYVSETVGNCILKFAVNADGSLGHRANFALLNLLTPDRTSRGGSAGQHENRRHGNMYVASGSAENLETLPDGALLHAFPIAAGDGTTNVAFAQRKDLYVTVVKDPNDPQAKAAL